MATFRALGANPTPMSFGELYTALQQKTVDAQENLSLLFTLQSFMKFKSTALFPDMYMQLQLFS